MGDEKLSCDVIFCPEVSGDTYEVSQLYDYTRFSLMKVFRANVIKIQISYFHNVGSKKRH